MRIRLDALFNEVIDRAERKGSKNRLQFDTDDQAAYVQRSLRDAAKGISESFKHRPAVLNALGDLIKAEAEAGKSPATDSERSDDTDS